MTLHTCLVGEVRMVAWLWRGRCGMGAGKLPAVLLSCSVLLMVLNLDIPIATAQISSGNRLYAICKKARDVNVTHLSDIEKLEFGYCMATAEAVNMHSMALGACIPPEGVTTGQILAVIIKYMNDYPDQRHLNIHVLSAYAVRAAWPCNR
jgi:Rap1a immunity proteins